MSGFLVSRLLVSKFYAVLVFGCLVAKFQGFTKCPFHVFLIDIDLTSKVSKNLLHGSSGFVGARFFQTSQKCGCSFVSDFQQYYLPKMIPDFSWII